MRPWCSKTLRRAWARNSPADVASTAVTPAVSVLSMDANEDGTPCLLRSRPICAVDLFAQRFFTILLSVRLVYPRALPPPPLWIWCMNADLSSKTNHSTQRPPKHWWTRFSELFPRTAVPTPTTMATMAAATAAAAAADPMRNPRVAAAVHEQRSRSWQVTCQNFVFLAVSDQPVFAEPEGITQATRLWSIKHWKLERLQDQLSDVEGESVSKHWCVPSKVREGEVFCRDSIAMFVL